ncbi:MAG TPA: CaiB/BaiF CoA-transferase family protein [Pseudomonadales bacterium]|nr:CaiB/BaiF CoA-transferase family protein [Pseudomonadales bacterium]
MAEPGETPANDPAREPAVPGPLAGLRVIELGQLIAGPFCGQLLGDLGAEVIKIEAPGTGDPMRAWGQGKPVWWPVIGRNKKSMTLDLRGAAGQAVLRDLAAGADILIENFRPGTLEKWGLGQDVLFGLNPRLIIVRVSGYGQTGPYAQRAGYGSIGEAMGGMRYLAGEPDRPPSRVGLSIGDALAATFACVGALAALEHVRRTGRGQVVDSAIYEAVLGMLESTVAEYTEAGVIRERTGAILPKIAPSNVYPTRDDEMILIGANQDSVFARLAEAMGQAELASDARYATHTARGEHQAELDARIAAWTRTLAATELLACCEDHGVPAGRIYRVPDMLADPQFQARDSIVPVAHPDFPKLQMQNVFPRLSETPGSIRWPGPALGAHTDEVLADVLGYDAARIAALRADGTI